MGIWCPDTLWIWSWSYRRKHLDLGWGIQHQRLPWSGNAQDYIAFLYLLFPSGVQGQIDLMGLLWSLVWECALGFFSVGGRNPLSLCLWDCLPRHILGNSLCSVSYYVRKSSGQNILWVPCPIICVASMSRAISVLHCSSFSRRCWH